MALLNTVVDLSEEIVFDKVKWIQKNGRNYPTKPSDVPLELKAYRDAAMQIPDAYREKLLPKPELTVKSFLAIDIPAKRNTLVRVTASKQFTSATPIADPLCLMTRKLPSLEFVMDAANTIGWALLNDAQSITDPDYKGPGLPVWVVQYWIEMHQALAMRTLWQGNLDWLDTHGGGLDVRSGFDQGRSLLLALPWSVELRAQGLQESTRLHAPGGVNYVSAEELTRMLSDRMLTKSLVDMMVNELSADVRSNPILSTKYEIVNLTFIMEIEKAKDKNYWQKKSPPYLRRLEEKLKGSDKCLEFPVYLAADKHFNVFEIDYKEKKICYGDSLKHRGMPKPTRVFEKLQWWLEKRFGAEFDDLDCKIEQGNQEDGISCGICAPNMIAHRVLKEPLWCISRAAYERVRWFNRIVEAHNRLVTASTEMRVPAHNMEPVMMPNSNRFPQSMRHLMNESNVPIYHDNAMAILPSTENQISPVLVPDAIVLSSSSSRADVSGLCTQYGSQYTEDTFTSDEDIAISLPDNSEYDSSLREGSFMSIDRNSVNNHVDSVDVDMEPAFSCPPTPEIALASVTKRGPNRSESPEAGLVLATTSNSTRKTAINISSQTKQRAAEVFKETKRGLEDMMGSEEERTTLKSHEKRPRKAPKYPSVEETSGGPIGISKSAVASRSLNQQCDDGTFVKDPAKWARFTDAILLFDKHAVFDHDGDPRKVQHSRCLKSQKMKEVYNVSRFEDHIKRCSGPTKAMQKKMPPIGSQSLMSMTAVKNWSKSLNGISRPKEKPIVSKPCPGLTPTNIPHALQENLATYLIRSPVPGGGGPNPDEVTKNLFPGQEYRFLTARQKNSVRSAQRQQYQWLNNADIESVFSASCTKVVKVREDVDASPCPACMEVLRNRRFKQAISIPLPDEKNLKFTPKRLLSETAIEHYARATGLQTIVDAHSKDPKTPCLLYAKGVINGEFKSEYIFTGLVEAMVSTKDKERRGVGLQGFKYAPGLTEFAHIINIHSPRAYQALRNILPLPTARSLQMNRARQPRFPIGIQERTFDLVIDHLQKLDYRGPLSLACDDTQLLPAFRPYLDKETGKHYIVGSTGEPLLVANPEELSSIIAKGEIEKASKIRLWCIQVPLPGVATIIAASMAISSSQNANDLLGYLERILLEGFVKRNIRITSYAADGTGTERSVQKLLTNLAPATKEYIIKHPGKGRPDITLKIPLFGPNRQPIVMIQDSKHAAKTYRNNAFSGARLLILGNYVVLYSHFRAIAFEGGPLYNRDVEKIDRQDDNAATRFGSGDVLQWLIENHPELLGPIVFLFVKYELIDGYQSRSMRHIERAQLALRALFFMEMWEQFLNEAGYPKAKHFLSHEACDITRFLIHGLLQLIIVYRDLLDDVYPLLPWLLSTEVCEHVFGLCRQIVKDFTEMDFIYMIPKLFIRLREHALFSHFSDGKERASGYNHTYTDNCGVNLVNLSIYPTDNEINNIAQVAYEEAENLWALLGAPPMLFTDSAVKLPSIHAWFAEPSFGDRTETSDDNGQLEEEEIDSDYESCVGGWDSDDEEPSEAAQIQDVLNYLEKVSLDSFAQEDEVNNLACAAVALSVQDEMTIHELPEPADEEISEFYAEDHVRVSDNISTCHLSPVNIPDEPSNAFDTNKAGTSSLSFEKLVQLRFAHQTKQAATGVRTSTARTLDNTQVEKDVQKPETERQSLLRRFNEVIKQQQERGKGTGAERGLRWGMTPAAGNAANAADAAAARSTKGLAKRKAAFAKYGLPNELGTANVSKDRPLQVGRDAPHTVGDKSGGCGYGFVLFGGKIMLSRVLSIYTKSGGKNGKHCWIGEASSITAISYIPVQLFEYMFSRHFRAVPQAMNSMQISQFTHLPSASFLCLLDEAPTTLVSSHNLRISLTDGNRFDILQGKAQNIVLALKNLNSKATREPESGEED